MKRERQIAELIFDKFRADNCKTGHIIMLNLLQFNLIDKLNPKERELFPIVLKGLINTGYLTYENISYECIRLTEKGYNYIYDDVKVLEMLQIPWVIPQIDKKIDWESEFNKLWNFIGPIDTAIYYMKGSQFYKFILDLCDGIPPTYNLYIEQRRKNNLLTSRSIYYKDLIDLLNDEKKRELFINIQLFMENKILDNDTTAFDSDFCESDSFMVEESNVTVHQSNEVIPVKLEGIQPKVFISYSWDCQEHEEWVLNLSTKLCSNGVDVILDKWELGTLGKSLPHFMENAIMTSHRVICVMTPNYKLKTEKLSGGVGLEYSIITTEIFTKGLNTSKFIPLFRSGTDADAIPTILKGRKYVDMREDALFEDKFLNELLRDIHQEPKYKKPPIGKIPYFD